jgi:hypothetical protein
MTEGGGTRRVQLPGLFRDLEPLATQAGITTAGVALDLARGESAGPPANGEMKLTRRQCCPTRASTCAD